MVLGLLEEPLGSGSQPGWLAGLDAQRRALKSAVSGFSEEPRNPPGTVKRGSSRSLPGTLEEALKEAPRGASPDSLGRVKGGSSRSLSGLPGTRKRHLWASGPGPSGPGPPRATGPGSLVLDPTRAVYASLYTPPPCTPPCTLLGTPSLLAPWATYTDRLAVHTQPAALAQTVAELTVTDARVTVAFSRACARAKTSTPLRTVIKEAPWPPGPGRTVVNVARPETGNPGLLPNVVNVVNGMPGDGPGSESGPLHSPPIRLEPLLRQF